MNRIDFIWPEGREGALTTSWDDGTSHDRRLVEIFNRHGIKGTFSLNSGKFGLDKAVTNWESYIDRSEVKSLYEGHEIAVHTVTHPWLQRQPDDMVMSEVLEDRRALEELAGYPVRGMALPFGTYDQRVLQLLRNAGILYVRPTRQSDRPFELPGNFMEWTVTCHHKADLKILWQEFINYRRNSDKLFYLWGHSYEFDRDNNWNHIEEFAALAGQTSNIWLATNMEVYEYVTAWRSLQCSVDLSYLKNITATTVWFRRGDAIASIKPGEIVSL